MDYLLTEEQIMIRDLARQIAVEKIVPVRAELDEQNKFPDGHHESHGPGGPLRHLYSRRIRRPRQKEPRTLYRRRGAFQGLRRRFDELRGQCARHLPHPAPRLRCPEEKISARHRSRAKNLVAFGLTEANAGSDASGVQTTAKLDGNEYVLNGTKQWITNGGEADIYTVIAITDRSKGARGASAFIVEKGTPGFTFGKKENKMGIRASSTTELIFNNCRIPKENLIAKEGMGFIVAMKTLDSSRTGVGAQGVGVAQGAIDEAHQVRQTAGPVRPAHHLLPGHPAHACRHADPDRSGARAGVFRCAHHRQRCKGRFPRFGHGQAFRHRCRA